MILTDSGRIVWYVHHGERVHDLKVVRYRGQRFLALFRGRRLRGSRGYYELLDSHYRVVRRLRFGGGYATDMHDLQLTERGTVYIGGTRRVHVRGVGRVRDWALREIDLATRRVLFEWHALAHVRLRASYVTRPRRGRTWDFFHGNSIEPPEPGGHTIIVSARHTSSVYGIDRRTGAVEWILGGKADQFGLRRHPGWWFCAQHDARRLPNGDLTLFDDGGAGRRDGTGCGVHAARVPQFRIDVTGRHARLVRSIASGPSSPTGAGLFPTCVGNAQRQPDGDTLVNWGSTGYITQVTARDQLRFAMRVTPWTYRVLRAPWVGLPYGRPRISVLRTGMRTVDVWASWNGATQIRDWGVITGRSASTLHPIGPRFRIADLETHLQVRTSARLVAVRALDAAGRELGRSRPMPVSRGPASPG